MMKSAETPRVEKRHQKKENISTQSKIIWKTFIHPSVMEGFLLLLCYYTTSKQVDHRLVEPLLPWKCSQMTGWLSHGPAEFISFLCVSRLNLV